MIDSGHVVVAGGRNLLGGLNSVEILDVVAQVILTQTQKILFMNLMILHFKTLFNITGVIEGI